MPSGDQAFRADLISAKHLCVTHDVQNSQPRTDDPRNTIPGNETMPTPSAAGYRQTHGTIRCIPFLPVASRHPGVRFRIQIGEPALEKERGANQEPGKRGLAVPCGIEAAPVLLEEGDKVNPWEAVRRYFVEHLRPDIN